MALHVLVGQEDFYDVFLETCQTNGTCSWIIPKTSLIGDDVLLYFRHLDAFVGSAQIMTSPESTMFRRRTCYAGMVGKIQRFVREVGLNEIIAKYPERASTSYPRSFTSKHPQDLWNTMMLLAASR